MPGNKKRKIQRGFYFTGLEPGPASVMKEIFSTLLYSIRPIESLWPLALFLAIPGTKKDNCKINQQGKCVGYNDWIIFPEHPVPYPATQTSNQHKKHHKRYVLGFFLAYYFNKLGQHRYPGTNTSCYADKLSWYRHFGYLMICISDESAPPLPAPVPTVSLRWQTSSHY